MDRVAATAAFLDMWGDGTSWADIPARRRVLLASQIHLIPAGAPAIEDDLHGVLDRLASVTCPVDLVEGSDSQPIIREIMDGLSGAIPQAKRIVIGGAGHMVPMTHPKEIVSALEGF